MQVTELESQGLKKNFRIVVDSGRINHAVETELKTAGERVKIPGFRPGNIPMKILQQRYGKSVRGDVLKQVINETTTEVVNERKLRPAMTPQINIENYQEDGELAYTMAVELLPDMPVIGFEDITLNRNTFDIADVDIDEAQARLAERSPTLVDTSEGTKAESGQVVTIDFKGTIDGVAFEGGTSEDFDLELGSGQFIAGFEDQLIGIKVGETRIVNVKFPDDYPGKEVAGKEAAFEVKVKAVKRKEPAVIDEDFAKARGFENVDKIRQAIKAQMINEYNQLVRNQLKKDLFDILEEKCDFELPQSMVDMEFNSIWERLQQAKAQGDESVAGKSEDELKEEYQQIARRRVKLGLLLAEVGTSNHIQISREELTRAVMQQASLYPGQEKMVMDFYRKNPERVDDLRGPILEEKAVDFVLSKVKYNDTPVSLKALAGLDGEESEADASKPASSKSGKPASAESKKTAKKKSANTEGNKE